MSSGANPTKASKNLEFLSINLEIIRLKIPPNPQPTDAKQKNTEILGSSPRMTQKVKLGDDIAGNSRIHKTKNTPAPPKTQIKKQNLKLLIKLISSCP